MNGMTARWMLACLLAVLVVSSFSAQDADPEAEPACKESERPEQDGDDSQERGPGAAANRKYKRPLALQDFPGRIVAEDDRFSGLRRPPHPDLVIDGIDRNGPDPDQQVASGGHGLLCFEIDERIVPIDRAGLSITDCLHDSDAAIRG